ncbi:lysine--tRNA ligase [Candidatus Berkelbacteria bacterium CG10_big_fil_rev_8_21_14_0_10_41_12]|uniref:Lysine--tRNA ligase n=1 Tax=Candidatus Berkelbacteria bacterium CG10_big_fil_rev_8_21_14_0_10_41_12 TaxID=1974513 RepID=A0A2M6WY36_9BACT|nr:MAG: lysine--tRNA ligase [Candidatus Berkelbacteria bacterium CG10_big_fil_rev_8_21_14_0_10_41_12]
MYWIDECVKKIIDTKKTDKYVCAAGITPSGIVHIGNLRDAITSEFVFRGLKEAGKDAEFICSWDDYDRLRKIPKGVPEEFSKYIGMPLYKVPDPYGCHDSYSVHFEKDVEKDLAKVGIRPRFIYQHKMYLDNKYYPLIKIALQRRKEIARILFNFKVQDFSKEDIEKYYPLTVYCEACNKDSTKITDYDGENLVSYECKCSHKETADISKKNIGKLVWKIDWPMRWSYEKVSFEPGGKEHSTRGGSFDVASKISQEIFNNPAPVYQAYEFIGIVGMNAKMSSSLGNVIKISDLLAIYEPEIIRWFYAKTKPLSMLNFAFDQQILKNYAEFDRFAGKISTNSATDEEKQIGFYSQIKPGRKIKPNSLSFRQLASFVQLTKGNRTELEKLLKKAGAKFSQDNLDARFNSALNWTENYAPPEYRVSVESNANKDYFAKLPQGQKEMIKKLIKKLDQHWSEEALMNLLYDIPKSQTQDTQELKKIQRKFFKNIYMLLIGQETGPRLNTFFLALGKEKVTNLLDINE